MFNQGSSSLKFFKRLQVYKNSTGTVEFNPLTREGRSYNWTFLAPINGVLVFNTYKWSHTTACHQSAVRSVLRNGLGRGEIVFADLGSVSPKYMSIDNVKALYKDAVELEVMGELMPKNTSAAAHRESDRQGRLEAVTRLGEIAKHLRLTEKMKQDIRNQVFETEFQNLMDKQCEVKYKKMMLTEAASSVEVETVI